MEKQVEIEKVVVRIGDKRAELTIDQARDLRDALDALLGRATYSPVWIYPVWPQPYISPEPYTITVGDNTAGYLVTGPGVLPG